MRPRLAILAAAVALVAPVALSACGGEDADLTIYSGRNERLVGDLIERFEQQSGLKVEVRYGDSAELAAQIAEEGDGTPADAFFAQDAGSLGSVDERLAPLPRPVLSRVPARFRDPRGRWVGTSARARVVAYNVDRVRPSDLPRSVFGFADPRWRGRIGFAPPNASFQAFVSAMRLETGDARARRFLEALRANEPKLLENNIQTVEAVGRGEIDVGLVNHYYLYELRKENPGLRVENRFLRPGDPGAFVNAAGVGVLAGSDSAAAAQRFARFLVGEEAQRFFSQEGSEYPVVRGVAPPRGVPPLEDVIGPEVSLGRLGPALRSTLELLDEVGFST